MTSMSAPSSKDADKDIVGQQQQPMTSTRLNWSLWAKVINFIHVYISVHIVGCELLTFGFEHVVKIPDDAILYRYRYLGYLIIIGIGFVLVILNNLWPTLRLFQEIDNENATVSARGDYTNQDQPPSKSQSRWKMFELLVAIGNLLFWLAVFEIGRLFYINFGYADPLQGRILIYYVMSFIPFVWWSALLGVISLASIFTVFID